MTYRMTMLRPVGQTNSDRFHLHNTDLHRLRKKQTQYPHLYSRISGMFCETPTFKQQHFPFITIWLYENTAKVSHLYSI